MNKCAALAVLAIGAGGALPAPAAVEGHTSAARKTYVVVFDFAGDRYGKKLADSIRLRLRGHAQYEVLDRLTTQEFSGPVPIGAPRGKLLTLMEKLACGVALYGTVGRTGDDVRVEAACIDLRKADIGGGWTRTFADSSERSRAIIARKVTEALRGQVEWQPPEYGDEPEPKKFGKPLNVNGGFEHGRRGWDAPDRVSTFLIRDRRRGGVLHVRTDLKREPWLAYRRDLRLGRTDPSRAPSIARDTSYGCVGGLEGVHYRGDWVKATPGRRYWLVADCNGLTAGIFFPKVFVKGFRDWSAQAEGLPETSLVERGMTAERFAALPPARRKQLIAADARKHPKRYLRECFRWSLACRCKPQRQWLHFAAPFPPRGGLPKDVEWLQVQIYSYWPPGDYYWDNVYLYADPTQKAPLPEEKARTPNFDKR